MTTETNTVAACYNNFYYPNSGYWQADWTWRPNPWTSDYPWWNYPPYNAPVIQPIFIPVPEQPTNTTTLTGSNTAVNIPQNGPKRPYADITINKNKLKRYNGAGGVDGEFSHSEATVYMNDGDEFEIELFNPTTDTYGAKFKINGEYISSSHLVLYPGQRIYLDRYLDNNNKFVFTTYEVDGSLGEAVTEAIKNNGSIEVEFYKKSKPKYEAPKQRFKFAGDYSNGILRSKSASYDTNGIIGQSSVNCFYSANVTTDDLTFYSMSNLCDEIPLKSADDTCQLFETGLVGEGGKSDTEFTSVNIDFEYQMKSKSSFKILPMSAKPIEVKDLVRHCTGCGKKAKKDHNFCASCGTKI